MMMFDSGAAFNGVSNRPVEHTVAFENASLSTILQLRDAYTITVPEFQRGYAWTDDQWRALWDDVTGVMRREQGEHYGGAIMIRATDPKSMREVDLIDGQQRLTTISILLRALGSVALTMRFRENDALQLYFDHYARGDDQLGPRLAEHRSFYARNLERAAEYFRDMAAQLSDEQRQSLVDALLTRFRIFVLVIQPSFDVHIAFETINNRGKPLSTLEKLKNRLIFLSANAQDTTASRAAAAEVHRCWKGVYTWLGRGRLLLDDDEFLRAHALGWFRHEKRADWLASQLFDDEFAAHSAVPPERIVAYVRSLEEAAMWWHSLNEPQRLPSAIQQALAMLQRTASASSRPMLLWSLIRLAGAHRSMTVDPAKDTSWCSPFLDLANEAERFAVLVLLANDRQANVGQTDLTRAAYALAHPGEPLYPRYPRLVPPDEANACVVFMRDHVRALISNSTKDGENYIDPRFVWDGFFDPKRIVTAAEDRFRRSTGFYNWQFSKILVYLWEEHLRGDGGLPEKKAWEQLSWDDSVEHVYPQTPHAAWADHVTFDGRTATALRSAVVNSLGNLLLLSGSRNASLSNNPFHSVDKLQGKAARYQGGSYSESQVAQVCSRWTVVQIAARGIAMMRLAQRHWDFAVVPENAKLTEWFPILFGDQASRILEGAATGGKPVDGRALQPWVEKFETVRPR